MPEEEPRQQAAHRERTESPPGQRERDDRDSRPYGRGRAKHGEPA